ncbi:Putative cell wall binding repeat-containing protein [Ruminococcaceae bacterium YRB3002]|nr:Putative cell wall binding repeat-containing protein [Ruminococcaceae bacterium YRB3002]
MRYRPRYNFTGVQDTGLPITPSVTIKDGSRTLVKGTDYTLSYSNNVNVGTATVTVTGKGNYSGTKKASFSITTGFAISPISDQIYTGSAITPPIIVKKGSKTLVKGTDYTVAYSNNLNVGTATVTVKGKGSYTDSVSICFEITAKTISGATVSSIADQTHTGSAIEPTVTVIDGSKTLLKGTDYTVSYSNNVDVGTATITVKGKGNYTGTKKISFTIVASQENTSSDVENIIINEENFPDENFRRYLREVIDVNSNGIIDAEGNSYYELEIVIARNIDVSGRSIRSLKGIEKLPLIVSLDCSNNQITELNVSNLPIDYLNCSQNKLVSLNINGCENLDYLDATDNELNKIYIKDCPLLIEAYDNYCQYGYLDDDGVSPSIVCIGYDDSFLLHDRYTDIISESVMPSDESLIVTYKWEKVSGKWYYVGTDGSRAIGFRKIDGTWYYFNKSGMMLTGWQSINGEWYYFESTGAVRTGWKKISNKWYYFNSYGKMATLDTEIEGKYYYFGENGVMRTGWQKIDGFWYHFGSSGAADIGWKKIGKKWYYFYCNGEMYSERTLTQNRKTYYFDSSGAMVTGWKKIQSFWHYFNSSGVMQFGWQRIKNKWYYFDYYGHMVEDTTLKIDGKYYTFNRNGVWIK